MIAGTVEGGLSGYAVVESLQSLAKQRREVGASAVWTLSSSKEGNGVVQLRDDNMETFWQSDGVVPHTITLQFQTKVRISDVALFLDYKSDESYAPEIVEVRGGVHLQDLREIVRVQLKEPVGWVRIPLSTTESSGKRLDFVYTSSLQIAILQMHSSGKDTHVRQMKVFTAGEQLPDLPAQTALEGKSLTHQSLR